jgi:hypothetical protein
LEEECHLLYAQYSQQPRPPQLRKSSADKLVHVIRAKADVTVMSAAHLDLGEHVLVSNLLSGLIDANHGAADFEQGDPLAAIT